MKKTYNLLITYSWAFKQIPTGAVTAQLNSYAEKYIAEQIAKKERSGKLSCFILVKDELVKFDGEWSAN